MKYFGMTVELMAGSWGAGELGSWGAGIVRVR